MTSKRLIIPRRSVLRGVMLGGVSVAVPLPRLGGMLNEHGTAYNAFLGFPLAQWGIAGKTGTAQAPPKQDTALFVGFGPTAAPQHVVAVVMEQSGFGASAAAPVARRVFGVLSGLEVQGPVQFVQANTAGD